MTYEFPLELADPTNSIILAFNEERVRLFLDLPLSSTPLHALDIQTAWRALCEDSRQQFREICELEPDLANTLAELQFHYAAFAHPDTGAWPKIEPEDILEYVTLENPMMRGVITCLNGQRFIHIADTAEPFMTLVEFRDFIGMEVVDFLKQEARTQQRRYELAVAACSPTAPTLYELCVLTPTGMEMREALAYSDKQARRYYHLKSLQKAGASVASLDPRGETVFNRGKFCLKEGN